MQAPRVSSYVAATGPHGLKPAAGYGQGWVTYGDPRGPADVPVEQAPAVVAGQLEKPAAACAERGRDAASLPGALPEWAARDRPQCVLAGQTVTGERGLTEDTSVPSRSRSVAVAAAVSVGSEPNHGSSWNDRRLRWS